MIRPTVAIIQRVTAMHYGIDIEMLTAAGYQQRMYSDARSVAIYLCRGMTDRSIPTIAKLFKREASCVYYSVNRVTKSPELMAEAAAIRAKIFPQERA